MWQALKNIYHLFQAICANIYYGFPGRHLIVIGVTGTDGKTTTVNLIYHILKMAEQEVSMVSTVGANIHGKTLPLGFHVTNPASWQLQKFLSDAAKSKKKPNYIVLEVSSHGIDQNRVWGIPFKIGVITNITPEHLDYHKTYENYLATKVRLLQRASVGIINKDDASFSKIVPLVSSKKIITFGLGKDADITESMFHYSSPLVGDFNRYNVLAAVAVCTSIGMNSNQIKIGIESFITPNGRMNSIKNTKGLSIYIDYAHTANGIKQALSTLKETKKGKLIAIIGGEGYRDEKKRAIIGEVSVKLADIVIITSVDPRGLLAEINMQILQGVKKAKGVLNKNVFIIDDRQEAIDHAVNFLAQKGDTIAILGKGHERSMNIDGKHEIPWSDAVAVEGALRR